MEDVGQRNVDPAARGNIHGGDTVLQMIQHSDGELTANIENMAEVTRGAWRSQPQV